MIYLQKKRDKYAKKIAVLSALCSDIVLRITIAKDDSETGHYSYSTFRRFALSSAKKQYIPN